MQSIDVLVMLVIGGSGSILGALLGSAMVTVLPESCAPRPPIAC